MQETLTSSGPPPVEEIRPRLWSIPVPIPNNPLGYTLVYGLETGTGIVLVDSGWNSEVGYQALAAGLRQAGYGIADVQGIMVTHFHPDHLGLAGRLQQESGGWVAMHAVDAAFIRERYHLSERYNQTVAQQLVEAGASPGEVTELANAFRGRSMLIGSVTIGRLIGDGDLMDVPGWRLRAVWTPGHSPGHLCFWEEDQNILFSGDHVLPQITPNVSVLTPSDGDPLGTFIASLSKLRLRGEPHEILPAHEARFAGLGARIDALIEHHEHRSDELCSILAEGPTTPWDLAGRLTWSIPRDQMTVFMRRLALGETIGHLVYLERRGRVSLHSTDPMRYTLSAAGSR